MACGLPVVTTDVGGNGEVVQGEELGIVLPFGNRDALFQGMRNALVKTWNRSGIIAYARENSWNTRVQILVEQFRQVVSANL